MTLHYYDRKGKRLEGSTMEWAHLFEDKEYKRVAFDTVEIDPGTHETVDVSTVWLGMDHSWGDGPPLIFESMVFGQHELNEHQWRYATEKEALIGHDTIVEAIKGDTAALKAIEYIGR